MQFWEYALVFLTPLLGGLSAFWVSHKQPALLRYILTFSGAYLLGLVFLHLLPELYGQKNAQIGSWVLAGFGIQILLEQLSKGIDHGHPSFAMDRARRFAVQIMFGLSLHALLEGLPLGGYRNLLENTAGQKVASSFHQLLFGILLHNIPAAFALTSFFLLAGYKRSFALLLLLLFAVITPISAFFANHFIGNPQILLILLALVTGNLLQIATATLAEAEEQGLNRHPLQKWLILLLGLFFSTLNMC
jgi:zinc transporter ZupT